MGIFDRFGAGPVDLARRLFQKKVIGPIRYRDPSGYDAERYWRHRFEKYGASLRGPGDEGLSEAENRRQYELAGRALLDAERKAGVDPSTARVLEIGCGPGFYAQMHADLGVASYMGVDVTDVLFEQLRGRFPRYRFLQMDVTRDTLEGEFDLVIMIDVAHHIVTDEAMDRAVETLKRVLAPGGVLLLGPVFARQKHHLFYVRLWSPEEIRARALDLDPLQDSPFRGGDLLGFRRAPVRTIG